MSISLHFFSRTSPSPSTTATDDGDDAGMTERLRWGRGGGEEEDGEFLGNQDAEEDGYQFRPTR